MNKEKRGEFTLEIVVQSKFQGQGLVAGIIKVFFSLIDLEYSDF